MTRPGVAVLFARRDSVYKSDPRCDVFDEPRNALTFAGGLPVVAHPPCRSWGQLAHFAKPRDGERELAIWAVDVVRRCGGVLEHPRASRLWKEAGLPDPGARDRFGGFTLGIDQDWFGHRAEKRTLLYIVGVEPTDIPAFPLRLEPPSHVVERMGRAEREHTPPRLASWLIELALCCARPALRGAA